MAATGSCGPVSAAIAARCDTFDTLLDRCDCRFDAALTASAGPMNHPTRQPVIA